MLRERERGRQTGETHSIRERQAERQIKRVKR